MGKCTSILLVGIGGYGAIYADVLLDCQHKNVLDIAGVVDPAPEGYERYAEISGKNIRFYKCIDDFYRERTADLAIISSPIQFHKNQSVKALLNGSNVLCEKPMCATVQEGLEMIEVWKRTRKIFSIGYQWSFSDAILELKNDIMKEIFGKPKRFRTIILCPRTYHYFRRNNWAGKKKDQDGNWILDSVVNNATAHYLHNMLFVLGKNIDRSAIPATVSAELYRANEIENYDTAAMRIITKEGVEIMYYATHAVNIQYGPVFHYEFERANVIMNRKTNGEMIAKFSNGKMKSYGNPDKNHLNKFWVTMNAINNNGSVPCTPEAAISHTICTNGAQQSAGEIISFPAKLVREGDMEGNDGIGRYIKDLDKILQACYQCFKLPAEAGISWAKRGIEKDITNYKEFKE